MDLTRPVLTLDPHTSDPHLDAQRMRQHGPIVPVELPGGVRVWTVTHDATAREVLKDTVTFRKELAYWGALQRGEVPRDWPLMGIVDTGTNMVTADGEEHTRLRAPLAKVFTARRMQQLQPVIEATVDLLLDELAAAAGQAPDGVVDFRRLVAWRLPMIIIGYFLDLPEAEHARLRALYDVWFDDTKDSTDAVAAIHAFIEQLIDDKQQRPGEDLISLMTREFTRQEVIDTTEVLIAAGHDTTAQLVTNAIIRLTEHPAQLALLLDGTVEWERAVEETMRYDPPTANFPFRFATQDTTLAGVDIRRGEAVMISYLAMGRDADRYGQDVDTFDLSRATAHTSFGHGRHTCLGAALARLEGRIALERLFTRFPHLEVVDDPPRFPSVIMNGRTELRLRLRPGPRREIDTSKPHAARMYDYYLGGKDWYPADEAAAQQVETVLPDIRTVARANRAFMHRATRVLAAEHGVRQFLDIGTGIPTEPNLHQVAQQIAPDARIVYVDNDPIVLELARGLLRSTPQGRTAYLHADLTTDQILSAWQVSELLDLSRPVALCLNAVLHFVPDRALPYRLVRRLMEQLAPGSFLVLSHVTGEFNEPGWAAVETIYREAGTPAQARTRAEIRDFFDGLELIKPGLVMTHHWRPDPETEQITDAQSSIVAGVARKPPL